MLMQSEDHMATIHIDGEDYETENLSENALAQVNNVQIVDQKIAQLQQDLAIMQTARTAFIQSLKADLPKS